MALLALCFLLTSSRPDSVRSVTIPPDHIMAWSPKGEVPKDIPGRVRGISEDGRIVLVDYPSGASMMGADVFKTRAIDLATRRALAIGSPGLSRGSNGRYSLSVAKEDPRPLQGAPGFFLPFYEADDQAFIS
ncbi:MAG TPA: hypothetical protein VKT78_18905, partial [Fimbriimonadaceae bacterium]|nr:hypothetical protein [Fimbriimonadaceae bacterium]